MNDILFSIFSNERFVDLGLYQYGWERCEPLYSYGPYARNHYLSHCCISGINTLISADPKGESHTCQARSGEGFLTYPKQINTYFAGKNHPQEYTWVEFNGLCVKEALELVGLTMDTPVCHSNTRNLSLELKNEILYIARYSDRSPLHLIGHLYLFLGYLTRPSISCRLLKAGRLQDSYVREAISFTGQNFQDNMSVEDITVLCNLNRSCFGKIFRNTVGKSPRKFLISYRMIKAAKLPKLTELSISDISNTVGHPNQLHLPRTFEKTCGIPPRQQRQENKMAPAT